MTDKVYLSVDEVAGILGVSVSYAYKLVRKLNDELKKMDYITISGKVNRNYFIERTCYGEKSD